jgi:hypothetical protein
MHGSGEKHGGARVPALALLVFRRVYLAAAEDATL